MQLWPRRRPAGWRGSGPSLKGLLYALSSSSTSLSSQDLNSASNTSLSRVQLPTVLLGQELAEGIVKAAAGQAEVTAAVAQGADPGGHQPVEMPGCLPRRLPRWKLRWPAGIACFGTQGDHSGKLHQLRPDQAGGTAGGKAWDEAVLAAPSGQLDSQEPSSSEDSAPLSGHLPSCLPSWASWPGLGWAGRR